MVWSYIPIVKEEKKKEWKRKQIKHRNLKLRWVYKEPASDFIGMTAVIAVCLDHINQLTLWACKGWCLCFVRRFKEQREMAQRRVSGWARELGGGHIGHVLWEPEESHFIEQPVHLTLWTGVMLKLTWPTFECPEALVIPARFPVVVQHRIWRKPPGGASIIFSLSSSPNL